MELGTIFKLILAIFCTVIFFFVGLQVGKDHTRQFASKLQCGTGSTVGIRNKSFGIYTNSTRRIKKKCKEVTDIEVEGVVESSSNMCHSVDSSRTKTLHMGKANVPEDIFSFLHHPSSPSKFSYFLTLPSEWTKKSNLHDSKCKEVYLTRTGSRANQPNKCVALVVVPPGYESINQQSHRYGYTAKNTDQYQQDYTRDYDKPNQPDQQLLLPFLREREKLIAELRRKVGDPIDPKTGKRRSLIVMVANEGVMDLLLNFFCSAEQIDLDLSNIVVFVGDSRYEEVIENMGGHAMFSPALGSMPSKAAGYYLDFTFSRMMWFKTTSVYLALTAGYEVLFQDVDLVWLKNPIAYLQSLSGDMIFMDDGARTPRYTPFFVNSGFYYVKHNPKTLYMFENFLKAAPGEIGQTHSHQSVLIKHIAESHHLAHLAINVLDQTTFPSGQAYHENKPLLKKIVARKFRPYVFHMCWTDNRENKVTYFKEIDMWYISENDPDNTCSQGNGMLYYNHVAKQNGQQHIPIRNQCCNRKLYWPKEEPEEIVSDPVPVEQQHEAVNEQANEQVNEQVNEESSSGKEETAEKKEKEQDGDGEESYSAGVD